MTGRAGISGAGEQSAAPVGEHASASNRGEQANASNVGEQADASAMGEPADASNGGEPADAILAELQRGTPAARALAIFDSLPAVRIEEMVGRWAGTEAPTGNPLDGLLGAYGWHGKRFGSPDDVDPLIFERRRVGRVASEEGAVARMRTAVRKLGRGTGANGVEDSARGFGHGERDALFAVEPAVIPLPVALRLPRLAHHRATAALGRLTLPLLSTRKPKARLRMVEYRGVSTATMIYDKQPIHDHFRRIDGKTLLGAMDLRGLEDPFFFLLRWEADARG